MKISKVFYFLPIFVGGMAQVVKQLPSKAEFKP
jgi:hypothetical protein